MVIFLRSLKQGFENIRLYKKGIQDNVNENEVYFEHSKELDNQFKFF